MKPLLFSLLFLAPAQLLPIDWPTHKAEILKHYRALVQIDSTSGNEVRVVDYIKKVLDAEGIPSKILALDPNRPNLVARLKGTGAKRPLLLMAHSDVVGVQREKWPVDPFGAILKDGYIWGRGTTDDKDSLTANLMVVLLLKRSAQPLDRDVIFLVESAEETDPAEAGISFMMDRHFSEIDAEYAITEGGATTLDGDKVTTVQIATTEKVPRRVRLIAKGTAGHGSVPRLDNALTHLGAAVQKVGTWQTPMRLNDTTRTYFEKLAAISPPEIAARYNGLLDPQKSPAIQRYLAEFEPRHDSMLRTSVVPTMFKAGIGANVIPSEAEATIDIRVLPDEDVTKFYAEMKKLIADPNVEIVPILSSRPVAPPSRLDNEMYRALEKSGKQIYPGSTTLPGMLTGYTDMSLLRAKGIQSYGIGPAISAKDRTDFGPHSDVERLLESSLYKFVEFTWTAVTELAAKQ